MQIDYEIVCRLATEHCSFNASAVLEQEFQAVHLGSCQITHQDVKDVHHVSYGYPNLLLNILLIIIFCMHLKYEVYLNASLFYGKQI